MDFRDFLQDESETLRLPYFAGSEVLDRDRKYRLRQAPERPGWYEFEKEGRYLKVLGQVESQLDEWDLKETPGYLVGNRFTTDSFQAELFGLEVDAETERFAPITAKRWFDGRWLFAGIAFESEVEAAVRDAFEDERRIADVKGVTPALANAFMMESMTRELRRQAIRKQREEKERRERAAEEEKLRSTFEGRVALALSSTGAELVDWRNQGGNRAVVKYRFMGQKFECVIDSMSLAILDSGICLTDESTGEKGDEYLNLASLPSVVREAVDTGRLVVYRRV